MDKMLTHTSNWDFDSGNAGQDGQPNNFEGDSTLSVLVQIKIVKVNCLLNI